MESNFLVRFSKEHTVVFAAIMSLCGSVGTAILTLIGQGFVQKSVTVDIQKPLTIQFLPNKSLHDTP